jgi:hypothetical protein
VTKKASPATLQDRLEEATPTAIRFKDGDVFAGIFDHLEHGETENGPCLIALFTSPDATGMLEPPEIPNGGQASVWLFHAALLGRLKRLRPAKGERIAIKRIGERTGGSGRGYIAYSVVSEREQAGEVTWDEVDPVDPVQPEDWKTGAFNDPAPF